MQKRILQMITKKLLVIAVLYFYVERVQFFISTKVTYSILNQVKIGHYLKLDAVVLAEKIVNFFLFCHYYLL